MWWEAACALADLTTQPRRVVVVQAHKLIVYGQNLRGAFQQQARRPQPAIVNYLKNVYITLSKVKAAAAGGNHLVYVQCGWSALRCPQLPQAHQSALVSPRIDRVLAMNSLEYVAHVFEDLLGKFRETFWMNEPSGMGRSQSRIQPPFVGFSPSI